MGENRFFYVESTSFEIKKNAFEMRIIERGRKHLSNVSMGFAAVQWLRDALLEVAKLSKDQNLSVHSEKVIRYIWFKNKRMVGVVLFR